MHACSLTGPRAAAYDARMRTGKQTHRCAGDRANGKVGTQARWQVCRQAHRKAADRPQAGGAQMCPR
eukprot:5156051-Alexandrium_andersonii.AAC.1